MAGGKGTRFWPRSTEALPKQFLRLTSGNTMLQETWLRFRKWLPRTHVYVVTTSQYHSIVRQQLPELPDHQILVEPDQRDTGPCIALTALYFLQRNSDEVLVTTPSDQYIPDTDEWIKALQLAEKMAHNPNTIITLGIVPTRPETGYGYIEAIENSDNSPVLPVKKFIEKPSLETAKRLISLNHVYWNSGIFVWKPSTISYYMNRHQPVMWKQMREAKDHLESVYTQLPKISVDYAILEKADNLFTIPVTFQWDDVGTWTALDRLQTTDDNGNQIEGNVTVMSTKNCIVHSERQKTIVIGVENLIIVSTQHGLLVCAKSEEQKIKKVLEQIRQHEGGNHHE